MNFSELTAVIVAMILTFSIAYPQFENINKNQKTTTIEFKSQNGEHISGELTTKEDKNLTLSILSLIGIILGPIILLWKFLIESKSIEKFYNRMYDLLKEEYETLLKITEFQNSETKNIQNINKIFTKIHDNGRVTNNDLLKLKNEISPHKKRYSEFGS
ncbi:MAG: hypothetical protein U5R06_23505 [candidate division KSB1 bacterium]|nr:hypothetical protein [candidate division KSB1 bacterium]